MQKKPPPRPNIILDRIPSEKRIQIEKVCAKHGTSIEKIPSWMLGLNLKGIEYRLRLFEEAARARSKADSRAANMQPKPKQRQKSKVSAQLSRPKKIKKKKVLPKKREKKSVLKEEVVANKIPNTLTGQTATWWLKNIVSRVNNRVKRQRMRRLIFDNVHLPLAEFNEKVVSKIDKLLTTKKSE